MTVRCVPSPGHTSKSLEQVGAAGHRLADLSDMLSKGELPIIPDTPKNWERIIEHWFSMNGDVWLPGCFCTVQTEEGHLALECVEGQSRLSRPSDHFIYFWL